MMPVSFGFSAYRQMLPKQPTAHSPQPTSQVLFGGKNKGFWHQTPNNQQRGLGDVFSLAEDVDEGKFHQRNAAIGNGHGMSSKPKYKVANTKDLELLTPTNFMQVHVYEDARTNHPAFKNFQTVSLRWAHATLALGDPNRGPDPYLLSIPSTNWRKVRIPLSEETALEILRFVLDDKGEVVLQEKQAKI